jgi:ribosomal-protein-alanine N-acetyltransferase
VTLRPARPEDADAIHALERQLFGVDAWSVAAVLEELTGRDRVCVVAERGGSLVGYAVTLRSGEVVDLQRIAVHPDHRRRGVARRLLGHLRDRARRDGAEAMLLEVSEANSGAAAFYAAEGFSAVGRRRRYYRDGTDALVLRLPFAEGQAEGGLAGGGSAAPSAGRGQ